MVCRLMPVLATEAFVRGSEAFTLNLDREEGPSPALLGECGHVGARFGASAGDCRWYPGALSTAGRPSCHWRRRGRSSVPLREPQAGTQGPGFSTQFCRPDPRPDVGSAAPRFCSGCFMIGWARRALTVFTHMAPGS